MYMKFYMTPGSCSTGIHILLEETGVLFEVYLVNLMAGDQHRPDYLLINPKATIPTLVLEDGSAITEFQAIAWWLGRHYPDRKLLPENPLDEVRVLEVMNYAVNTLHGQGFARIFTTDQFTPSGADHPAVQKQGREIIDQGLRIIDDLLKGREYVVDHFSIADAALFYIEFWADQIQIPLPENCLAHYRRLLQRPAVQQVLIEEGYGKVVSRAVQ